MIKTVIKENLYLDSIFLMTVTREMQKVNGVREAVVVMGTEMNKTVLAEVGALTPEAQAATANSLILSLDVVEDSAVPEALKVLDNLMSQKADRQEDDTRERSFPTVDLAVQELPCANLAVISLSGEFAGQEAMNALKNGMSTFIFSDNVPLEEELELKRYAREHNLWVMGPGCGTSVINGISLGLMSKISQGAVGIVGASGSGIQEIAVLVDQQGEGVSQAIGTGGRDLSKEIGGITMLQGLDYLDADPKTKVIVLVSKPPHPETCAKIYARVKQSKKPIVIFFLGGDRSQIEASGAYSAATLEEAANIAVKLVRGEPIQQEDFLSKCIAQMKTEAMIEHRKLNCKQKFLRGLYCGGTHSEEAVLLLNEILPDMHSNLSFGGVKLLKDPKVSEQNSLVDMGDELFTRGRPHPVMDPSILTDRLWTEGTDPEVGVILFDLLLGYAVHPDPVGTIRDTLAALRKQAAQDGRNLCFVASICGTRQDPQDISLQKQQLEALGVHVFYSNSKAAIFAGIVIRGEE